MPGRSPVIAGEEYRYGAANGQEKDDEISGIGNHYTAQYWEYDSRLGRRWNIDPVVKNHESPYATFANNPIWFLDPNGADSVSLDGKDGVSKVFWRVEEGDTWNSISKRTGVDVKQLTAYNTEDDQVNLNKGTFLSLEKMKVHFVYEGKTPNIYNLTISGLVQNPNWFLLTYNGSGSEQTPLNRKEACPPGSCAPKSGFSCDEFPYASTREGGAGAVANCVPSVENNIQGGHLSALYRTMSTGDQFLVQPVPRMKEPTKAPFLDPAWKPAPLRVYEYKPPPQSGPAFNPFMPVAGPLKAFRWILAL